mgnify:CR=1 FL=1
MISRTQRMRTNKTLLVTVLCVITFMISAPSHAGTYKVKIKEYGRADLTVKIKTYGRADKDICITNPDDLPDWFREMLE